MRQRQTPTDEQTTKRHLHRDGEEIVPRAKWLGGQGEHQTNAILKQRGNGKENGKEEFGATHFESHMAQTIGLVVFQRLVELDEAKSRIVEHLKLDLQETWSCRQLSIQQQQQ